MASLAALAALLATGPAASATEAGGGEAIPDGGSPAAVSALSQNWTGPWSLSFLPDGDSALATERHTYRVFRLHRDGRKTQVGKVPHTVAGPARPHGNGGLLGVAPSPTWNGTTDKRVYFMHTTQTDTRVVRMDYDGATLSGYTTLVGGIQRGGDHNGGKIAFGPDGYLYVATGDGRVPALAQDKNSLNGKILRITASGAPAPGNPFGTRVFSYGHRNPQGLAWDRNGRLWTAEIGEDTYDELNLIKPGANYGWPTCEGPCGTAGMTGPKAVWKPEEGVPAQLAVVRNVLYVATLRGQRLWRVPINGDTDAVGAKTAFYPGTYGRLRAVAKVPGADALWLGSDRREVGKDVVLEVTIK
ncbi:PQQ-dependent sugar dehydrogenase [Streptomyces sp. TRM64462]|uniref:PQQ-dependent sugar dehydrogenase n=1 Tax=Streptomyces sp. TRM64462 TaxID=2741726 RepID=UPI00281584DB|nr:PQQ-dependent sugar dehydrogenase [Streptomyces sp. TRM64462]